MAVQPGEENVGTFFGDIHYFFGPRDTDPPHHRFDTSSYIYIFENALERRARIEVANRPGTDLQDAFEGFLDKSHVRYSYSQTNRITLTVSTQAAQPPEWHLPAHDPRNETKYLYAIHSVDIYFWTQGDALQFLSAVRRVLPASAVEVQDEPGPPVHARPTTEDDISPVVQNLERVALSDSQAPISAVSGPDPSQPHTLPPPPPIPPPTTSAPQNFAPMAYNPAAPAAPEQVRHREKTPPPEDTAVHPLAAAVAYDYQQQPFSPGYPVGSPGFPPPGTPFGGPAHPGLQRAATMPVHGMPSPGLPSPYGGPAYPTQSFPTAQPQQQVPQGYSNYVYSATPQQPQQQYAPQQQGAQDYSLHHQVYRPTEGEATSHTQYKKTESRGKLEERAARLEKGVGGMLKKFEKKFG